ncbi:unnamed protein product [Heterobilharzia americana]|nr:unnamed protein product [Heterobilharzia americana]
MNRTTSWMTTECNFPNNFGNPREIEELESFWPNPLDNPLHYRPQSERIWKKFQGDDKYHSNGESLLHEIVFCFNENLSPIDCPPESTNDLEWNICRKLKRTITAPTDYGWQRTTEFVQFIHENVNKSGGLGSSKRYHGQSISSKKEEEALVDEIDYQALNKNLLQQLDNGKLLKAS